jgi:RND family efflux transporter MFP subunit
MASPGTTLVSVVDISQVVARANISVADAAYVKVGDTASLAGPEGSVAAKVTVVSPAVNPATTTIEIWVLAPNPGEKLKPGGTIRVNIAAETVKDAVIVPAAALLNADDGGHRVMVVKSDGTAEEHKVTLGIREGDNQQVLTGVDAGDEVIVTGALGLEDKSKVKVTRAPAAMAGEDEKK